MILGKRLTNKDYIDRCKEKGYDLPIEPYKNARTKINFKCKQGHIYKQSPSKHLYDGRGCLQCYKDKHYLTLLKIKDMCKENDYDLPLNNNQEYVKSDSYLLFKCKQGHIYKQRVSKHLNGHGCYICRGGIHKPSQVYLQECKERGQDLPIEDYINSHTKIKHKCSKGHIYEQTPDMHIGKYKQGCQVCNESHGEKFIRNYLDKNNIKYIPQKKFKDLKDKNYLSYDFYLPKYKILIEYQGKQHYEECNYFGGEEQLKKQQVHDKLKREYAKNNGYKLLELKYTLDTQELVDKYLSRRIKRNS